VDKKKKKMHREYLCKIVRKRRWKMRTNALKRRKYWTEGGIIKSNRDLRGRLTEAAEE
jgi:hypothetical protein